ncbi:MAG: hypothetical protein KatS3mg115_2530 [Candidatus Poribacteria bacterium]|nr:MAG: hypothetical protein KatS3mg115_2530 [Candidatus Poribacteria bacterium]
MTARRNGQIRRGRVLVRSAEPPKPVVAVLRGEREVLVQFDEPIEPDGFDVRTIGGPKVADWRLQDERSLLLILREPPEAEFALELEGILDRAQRPNRMPRQKLIIRPTTWPRTQEGLLFAWQTGDQPNQVPDPETGGLKAFPIKPRGRAHLNHDFAMRLAYGAYLVEGADEWLLRRLKATHQLTLEALVWPDHLENSGPARIVTFSSDPGSRNFTLGQEKNRLIFRLRTPQTGPNGTNPEITLGPVSDRMPTHVVITYRPGKLIAYFNGEKVLESEQVQGDFSNWERHHFLFGDEWSGQRDWHGTLEGVALFDRVLSAEEVRAEYEAYRKILLSRPIIPQIEVEAELIAASRIPTLQEISPYREALVVNEYRVLKAFFGDPRLERIRVVHWALMDGQTLEVPQRPGQRVRLRLEPYEQNRQLEGFYTSDTLELDFDAPLFYALP